MRYLSTRGQVELTSGNREEPAVNIHTVHLSLVDRVKVLPYVTTDHCRRQCPTFLNGLVGMFGKLDVCL